MLTRGKIKPDPKNPKMRALSFVAISYFPKTPSSVTYLQLTLELSIILRCLGWKRLRINRQTPKKVLVETCHANKRWPHAFRLASSLFVVHAKCASFSCKRLTNVGFFSSVLPKASLSRDLKQVQFRARRLCVNCTIWIRTTEERYFNEGWATGLTKQTEPLMCLLTTQAHTQKEANLKENCFIRVKEPLHQFT